ncbi:hypothetical protein RIR_jg3283.t2 [Rhizophagus irregularis DAOM 181602=DAOM 197198]|nr:hypothetical protein RIR_jg3283.t2 [Rhizophagus irregularis DAOM 181602=DAOM 197198]
MRSEYEIIGDEKSRRIDYAIKTRFQQRIGASCFSLQEVSQGDKLSSSIEFFKDALVKDSGKYQTLHNGVKEFQRNCRFILISMETSCINHRLRLHLFIFVFQINKIVHTNARQFRDEIIGLTMEIWMVLVLQQ